MLPVGMVGRPFPHVVRGVFCEGDEGIAEVREQHRYPPSAYAVRECSGNCRGRSSSLSEIMQIVTSAVRAIYLACVQCRGTLHRGVLHPGVPVMWNTHIRDLSPTVREAYAQGNEVALRKTTEVASYMCALVSDCENQKAASRAIIIIVVLFALAELATTTGSLIM